MSIYSLEGLSVSKSLSAIDKEYLAFTFLHLSLFTGYHPLPPAAAPTRSRYNTVPLPLLHAPATARSRFYRLPLPQATPHSRYRTLSLPQLAPARSHEQWMKRRESAVMRDAVSFLWLTAPTSRRKNKLGQANGCVRIGSVHGHMHNDNTHSNRPLSPVFGGCSEMVTNIRMDGRTDGRNLT